MSAPGQIRYYISGGYGPPPEAATLEEAADILASRSTRPRSILLAAFCKMLRRTAAKIRDEAAVPPSNVSLVEQLADPSLSGTERGPVTPPP